ncbi:MAG: PAS domain-containing sensor histidine kinase [Ignavibacterium sp.]|jgi:PAS domain S-box-containing protein
MHSPAPEYWWAIGIGTVGLALLTVAFLVTLVLSQKRLRTQLEETRKSERKYRNLFENSLVGMFRCTVPDLRIIDCNRTLLTILGRSDTENASSVFEELPSDVKASLRAMLLRVGSIENAEIRLMKAQGDPLWISVTCRMHASEGYAEGVVLDVTERRLAEERVREFHTQLRTLSARLESVREEERVRLARQVHDELGQILTAAKIHLTVLMDDASKAAARAKAGLVRKFASLIGVIDQAIDLVKNISYDLRPLALDELGLKEAVEWEAEQFGRKTGIRCRVQSEGDVELEREQATAVFRILQEALTNVARHAEAKTVEIELRAVNGTFFLKVSDDGRGITEPKANDPRSLGILGMRERAMFLGGEVHVFRNNGRGTVVNLTVPLK